MAQPQLVIFTDLDGTLLDHDSYGWHAAEPAVRRLRAAGIPLVINSSKTASEISQLRRELGNTSPYIVENGAALVIPAGCFGANQTRVHNFGASREELLKVLAQLREQGFRFRGFADMRVEKLVALTGLDNASAERARSRYATEPLIWEGSDRSLADFRKALSARGLRLLRGGRFWHVMGNADKADALRFLLEKYRARDPDTPLVSVALGDSPNDEQMLAAADIAVVVPNPLTEPVRLAAHPRVIRPDVPGPKGWNQAITALLDQYGI